MATKKAAKKRVKKQATISANKPGIVAQAKYPRHSLERSLRIPRAIIEQNAGRACTPVEAAGYLGIGFNGPFQVEVSSSIKYGLLTRPEAGKIQPTDLARRIL